MGLRNPIGDALSVLSLPNLLIRATMVSLLLLLCLTLPVLLLFLLHKYRTIKSPSTPPGPTGLPIIGNLHQLDNSALPQQLRQLAKTYGPIFSLQLGFRPAIVVSSPKLAKEVLKTYDLEFCSRPSLLGQQKLSYNGLEILFSTYNDNWREFKKNCGLHIFSPRRVSSFSPIRQFEVKRMIQNISRQASSSEVTNLNEILMSLTRTIICRIAFGRRYEEEGAERARFRRLFREIEEMIFAFFVSDYIPFTGWIDKLTGLHARLERLFQELDTFYREIIDEHLDPNRQKSDEEDDIIDVLLELKKQHSCSFDLTYDHIKAVAMDILLGGTDTSAATSVWAMTALMKEPRAMHKVQAEVRNCCGNRGLIDEDDIQNLPYLKAVIKETFRLYPPVPLLVQREARKKCIIEGYEIQDKTLVYVNVWAIQRDPEVWKDPEDFYPERFLNCATDFKGQDFELIPFGSGRRMCPGLPMGVVTVELILANLLYWFDWELPKGMKKEDIDTEMLPGLAQHKKNPLCLLAKNHA